MLMRTATVLAAGCLYLIVSAAASALGHAQQFLLYDEEENATPPGAPPGWTVLNHNNDATTWETSEYGGLNNGKAWRLRANPIQGTDDELRSPAFFLQPDKPLLLTFHVHLAHFPIPNSRLTVRLGGSGLEKEDEFPLTLLLMEPIPIGFYQEFVVPLEVDELGEYWIELHAEASPHEGGPPYPVNTIWLAGIRFSQPEEVLQAGLQLNRPHFDPRREPVYRPGDTIGVMVHVRNTGAEPIVLNRRMALDSPGNRLGGISFLVIGPDGREVPLGGGAPRGADSNNSLTQQEPTFHARVRRAPPDPGDFVEVQPGEAIYEFFDLGAGYYDLQQAGEYTVQARYRNVLTPGRRTAWRGSVPTEQVSFNYSPVSLEKEGQ